MTSQRTRLCLPKSVSKTDFWFFYPLFLYSAQLRKPTFSNKYLSLDRVVKFISYDSVRELDENLKQEQLGFNIDWLTSKAESL